MEVYIVQGYDEESSWISKIFDNKEAADKYAEYMSLTNEYDETYGASKVNVESTFDLDINEFGFFFTTRLDKVDDYFDIYTDKGLDKESIEEYEDFYFITVKIKYNEYKDEDEHDKIIEERARKLLKDYLNEKDKSK